MTAVLGLNDKLPTYPCGNRIELYWEEFCIVACCEK